MKAIKSLHSLSYTWIGGMEPDDSVTSIWYGNSIL